MTARSPTPAPGVSPTPKARKSRTTQPRHYKVTVNGVGAEWPVLLVLAKTQKDALDHVCQVALATNEDLISAGRESWTIVDLVNPAQGQTAAAK